MTLLDRVGAQRAAQVGIDRSRAWARRACAGACLVLAYESWTVGSAYQLGQTRPCSSGPCCSPRHLRVQQWDQAAADGTGVSLETDLLQPKLVAKVLMHV